MFRTSTIAAIALTIVVQTGVAAWAGTDDPLNARIHDAAVKACAPEHAEGALPRSHYGAIDDHCIYRVSREAVNRYQAQAAAKQSGTLAHK